MSNKTAKNLVSKRDQYNQYYGNFKGVDFSSDHTRVHDQRLSYSVNMYKDYQSAQGDAIETIPGFRIRKTLDGEIYGIHTFRYRDGTETKEKILIHHGSKLSEIILNRGIEKARPNTVRCLFEYMNERKSTSFMFNNRLYLIDGKNYIYCYYDAEEKKISVADVADDAYVPTAHKGITIGGEVVNGDTEYEQKNLLSDSWIDHYKVMTGGNVLNGDGEVIALSFYPLSQGIVKKAKITDGTGVKCPEVDEINIYSGQTIEEVIAPMKDGVYRVYRDLIDVKIFDSIVVKPAPKEGAELEITQYVTEKSIDGIDDETIETQSVILGCTLATVYDGRVFFSGNPRYPSHIFYCGRNSTGFVEPSYFGELNYVVDGVGATPITALLPVANALVALKSDTVQDGSVFYHTRYETGENVVPVTYPSDQGLNGTGCLGACINFLDDPIFISRFGVEGIGQLSARYERAIEHRSSLIDAKLLNLGKEALKTASLAEWNGYLVLLCDGKIFLADSRQRYTHDDTGTMQYEWYYLEDIGIYVDQYDEYRFGDELPDELEGKCVLNRLLSPGESCTGEVETHTLTIGDEDVQYHTVSIDGVQYYVEPTGAKTGGTFSPAVCIREIDGNLFFGTKGGHLCSFNFDKRNEYFEIPTEYYSFNGRTIFSGCATKLDNCGIPHLTKSTVNKSLVVKTKHLIRSAAKIAVRTNKNPMTQLARINSSVLNFEDIDFGDFTTEQTLFAVSEKEKQWVEKQYYIYSDEYQKPFALFYIAYRYSVCGRIKN